VASPQLERLSIGNCRQEARLGCHFCKGQGRGTNVLRQSLTFHPAHFAAVNVSAGFPRFGSAANTDHQHPMRFQSTEFSRRAICPLLVASSVVAAIVGPITESTAFRKLVFDLINSFNRIVPQ